MSNRVLVSLFAVLGVLAGFESRLHAQDAEKGASLLAEARKAIGGEDKLRALKTVQANGSFKRTAGNNTLEGDFEIFIEQPNRYRRNETTGSAGGPIGERVEVLNGTEVWEESSNGFPGGRFGFGGGFGRGGGFGDGGGRAGGGRDGGQADGGRPGAAAIDPERLREAQRRQRQNELARLMLMWFLTTEAPVAWVGTAQAPDGTADVIEVKPGEGAATRVFLDSATHMPLMMTTTGFGGGRGRRGAGADGRAGGADGRAGGADGRGGQPAITIETHLSEYKAVNGIKLPHLITRGVNGQTNEEWELKNYRINPNLKQNTFTK